MNFKNLNFNHLDFISDFKLKIENYIFYLLILFLPTQLGKHFWPDFSFVAGLRIDYLSPTVYFTDVLVGALFILWFSRTFKERLSGKSKIKSHTFDKLSTGKSKIQFKIQNYKFFWIWLFCICYLLSIIVFSEEILKGLYFALKILEMAFVGYYSAKFAGIKSNLKNIIAILSIGVLLESVLAIAQFVKQGSIGGVFYFLGERSFTGATPGIANASLNGELVLRPYGTLPHPNVLAGYLLVSMSLIFFLAGFQKQEKTLGIKHKFQSVVSRQWPVAVLLLGSISLLLTMSRVVIMLWILILSFFFFKKINLKVFFIGAIATITLLLLSPVGTRFTQVVLTDEAIVQRLNLINASVEMISSSPLFGVGFGNFIPTLAQISGPLTVSTYLQPVHNIFLLVAAETGLIGLGFFVWFLEKTYIRIKKQELRIKELSMIVFGVVLVTGLFDHYWLTLQQGQMLLAVVIGLSWSNHPERGSSIP